MKYVKISFENQIARITISRPDALNALNSTVIHELDNAISKIMPSKPRVLVITGDGNKSFVAGADIAEMSNMSPIEARNFLSGAQRVFDRIETLPIPVIALVNGFALGGGMELALACDIRIATDNAIFGLPEVRLGLIPSAGGTQRLTRAIGTSQAKSMILLGKNINVDKAKKLGIVTEVGTKDNITEILNEVIKELMKAAPIALDAAKKAIYDAGNTDILSGQQLELNYGSMCFTTDDLREGMGAFLEKRPANFKGS